MGNVRDFWEHITPGNSAISKKLLIILEAEDLKFCC